jgi:hypothetical protein
MTIVRIAGIAAAAAALAGCPGEREPETQPAEVPVIELGPGVEPTEVEALPLPERVELREVQASGVAAEAVISPIEGATHIALLVRQAPPNATLQAAVHSGPCATPGPQVAGIETVTTDAAGTGRAESTIDTPGHLLFDGQHHIQVHGAAETAGQMVACADIPARAVPRLEPGSPGAEPQPGLEPGSPTG